jgi:hypothetical protein
MKETSMGRVNPICNARGRTRCTPRTTGSESRVLYISRDVAAKTIVFEEGGAGPEYCSTLTSMSILVLVLSD